MRCTLSCDRWSTAYDHVDLLTLEAPTAADFEAAFTRLDASVYTTLTLAFGDDHHLGIGGGAGRYVVYSTVDNRAFMNLVSPDAPTGLVSVLIGGQLGDYPAEQVVDATTARAAGLAFLDGGRLDPSHPWRPQ
jgi:hypothetical protein